jgi:3-dehydroquinate dehydratase type I
MICVSIADYSQLGKVVESGAELVELRLDLIREDPARIYLLIPDYIRSVATCRPGPYDDVSRLALLKSCLELGASYVDVELESGGDFVKEVVSGVNASDAGLIISYHNFERTPDREELEGVMMGCYEKGGHVAKIATRVDSRADIRNLLSLYDLPGRKVILGMGPMGRITRLISPYLGAEFTFASLDAASATAPGQLTLKELKEIYNVIDKS